MMTSLFALLSLRMPPLGMLSSALVALVTLRNGEREGLQLMLLSSVACAALGFAVLGTAAPVIAVLLVFWLPVWLVAVVLRVGRSLPLAVEAAAVMGALLIVGIYVFVADPVSLWRESLEELFAEPLLQSGVGDASAVAALLDEAARLMTGMLAAGFFLQLVVALLLGRWWQAHLYKPGGFREEFHAFRLDRVLAYAALPFLAGVFLTGGGLADFFRDGALLLGSAYLVQGMALVHGISGAVAANQAWLIGFYVLLVIAMPQAVVIVATLGYVDAWVDFRAKLRSRTGK